MFHVKHWHKKCLPLEGKVGFAKQKPDEVEISLNALSADKTARITLSSAFTYSR